MVKAHLPSIADYDQNRGDALLVILRHDFVKSIPEFLASNILFRITPVWNVVPEDVAESIATTSNEETIRI